MATPSLNSTTIKKIDEQEDVVIHNISKQMVSLQLTEEGADFYKQQQAHLSPGKFVTLPSKYILKSQVNNLAARRFLKIAAAK